MENEAMKQGETDYRAHGGPMGTRDGVHDASPSTLHCGNAGSIVSLCTFAACTDAVLQGTKMKRRREKQLKTSQNGDGPKGTVFVIRRISIGRA